MLAGLWVGWQAVHVRHDQAAVAGQVAALRAQAGRGDYLAARRTLAGLRVRLDDAAARTSDPVWSVLAQVPVLGRDLAAVRAGTRAGDDLARTVLPDVERLTELLQDRPLLQAGAVRLDTLRVLDPLVQRAAAASTGVRTRLAVAPRPLLPVVQRGLDRLTQQVAELDDGLRTAGRAFTVLPAMLGADGPRTYFLAVQNNAESRATGGLIGSYAVLVADHGRLTLTRTGSDTDLRQAPRPLPQPEAAAGVWTQEGSGQFWYNANLTPHFPDVASTVTGLWAAQGGGRLDGVLALDPVALSDLLRPAGPVSLPGGLRVGADDVVDFALHREYVLFPAADQTARKRVLTALAEAIFHRVVASPNPAGTLRGMVTAAGSGHVLMWSRHPAEQSVLLSGRVGGALPATRTPFLEVLTQNYAGNKLDYYLHRTVTVTPAGPGRVRVVVTLLNAAPAGLPAYMTVRADRPAGRVPVGQAKTSVAVYGGLGALFDQVQVDGRPATMTFDTDHGHGLGELVLELPPGVTRTLSVLVTEPPGVLVYRQQPLAHPDVLVIDVPHQVIGV